MADGAGDPQVAVVIPAHDEAGNVGPLLAEVADAFRDTAREVFVVDDASADGTAAEAAADGSARVLRHRRRAGKSAAILTGARRARAPWIATLDGDGQNDPRDAARIVHALLDGSLDADLVAGRRRGRRDGFLKRAFSRAANVLRRRLFRDPLADTGCGLKVIRREVLLGLPAFSTMHRFLGVLVVHAGGRVAEFEVADRPRGRGRSKYGILDRLSETLPDMLGLLWLRRRRCAAEPADGEGEGT